MTSSSSKIAARSWCSLPRPVLTTIAVLFCAATTVFSFTWMYDARHPQEHSVEIGFNISRSTVFDARSASIPVYNVAADSPAQRAGLLPGDQIIAIDGITLTGIDFFTGLWTRSAVGDPVELTVRRAGLSEPITLHAVFRAATSDRAGEGIARTSVRQIMGLFPIFFLLVGFAVLFLRIEDPFAWLLAVLFACFVATQSFENTAIISKPLLVFLNLFRGAFNGMLCAVMYLFFSLFPEKSPLERRAPWLKWIALALGISQALPGMGTGDPHWPELHFNLVRDYTLNTVRLAMLYSFLLLAVVSLVWTRLSRETSAEARRKSRVMLLGIVAGMLPAILARMAQSLLAFQPPFWVNAFVVLVVLLYPLSFAYAIVKHRVLEIPVLLRRSARFVLVQRGYFILLFCGGLLAIFLFARFFSGYFSGNSQYGMTLSAVFGVALVWVSGPVVKRGTVRIDRAFFRSSYDARIILQDLAEEIRTITNRQELARLLVLQVEAALHPVALACYLEASDGNLAIQGGGKTSAPETIVPPLPRPKFPFRFGANFILRDADTIPANLPLLTELAQHGKTWEVPPAISDETGSGAALAPECLVPILGRNGELIGLLVLGRRLSEEPYSGEDKHLLESAAGQAAVALENIRLAEQIADRIQMDRRAEQEIRIAREVQSRLFPQVMPHLTTLDYAGSCIQARQVGGDYYDFLDLGSSQRLDRGATRPLDAAAWHLAFLLADISGKGIAAALLMANLQANLRSRYALALDDLPRLLCSVNQLFYENTPDDRYATLFFAVYDDHSRDFEYANCGHNAPLLFRADGSLERLRSTSTVIGLFPKWECVTRRITLAPGDLLVIYTDGVTEACDASSDEFGEGRLVETVREHLKDSPAQLLSHIQEAVQRFSAGEQSDDLTLVVARAR